MKDINFDFNDCDYEPTNQDKAREPYRIEYVTGNSGTYSVQYDENGAIIYDGRPWQMRHGAS